MKDEATILDDSETVELLAAQPELLAIADAVRATQRRGSRAWTSRTRLLLAVAAVAGLAAVGAWAFTDTSGKPRTAAVVVYPAHAFVYSPYALAPARPYALSAAWHAAAFHKLLWLDAAAYAGAFDSLRARIYADSRYLALDRGSYAITRTNGPISSIAVTVLGRSLGGSVLVQVHRKRQGGGRVVFSERGLLTPFFGSVGASGWLGTLSPADWAGGCRDARYWLTVGVSQAPRRTAWSAVLVDPRGFNCRHP